MPTAVLRVTGTPVPQGSMTCVGGGAGRPHNIQPSNRDALHAWRDKLAAAGRIAAAKGARWCAQDPVWVTVTVTLPRPASQQGPHGRPYPSVAPDIDKLARAVLDALTQAAVWGDDGQCVGLHCYKCYPGSVWGVPYPQDVLDEPGAVIRVEDAPAPQDTLL